MSVTPRQLWLGLYAITWREIAKFLRQTERLISAVLRPGLWLLVFATGMRDLLGVSIIPPYQTFTPYQEYILPAVIMVGLMLGSIGLVVSVYTPKIENFAGMMNFVVFPMFFLSAALYPLWKLREAGAYIIWYLANANPFTYAVELIRFAAYGQIDWLSLGVVIACTIVAFVLAAHGYNPQSGAIRNVRRA
jgi:ABC-type polysaccharide/polyol phosphate export permease